MGGNTGSGADAAARDCAAAVIGQLNARIAASKARMFYSHYIPSGRDRGR
jgi:hypothetical protein